MCHNSNYNDAYSNGIYDFSYVFADITEQIQSADIAVGNLETTFAGAARGYSNYPTFNTPEALATDLKEMGIDLLSTSNNHSLDKGYSGIESTINFLDAAGIAHTGTYTSPESQNTIVVQDVKGIKIAFLSFTYGTNGISVPTGKEYCIDLISDEHIINQINLVEYSCASQKYLSSKIIFPRFEGSFRRKFSFLTRHVSRSYTAVLQGNVTTAGAKISL